MFLDEKAAFNEQYNIHETRPFLPRRPHNDRKKLNSNSCHIHHNGRHSNVECYQQRYADTKSGTNNKRTYFNKNYLIAEKETGGIEKAKEDKINVKFGWTP